MLGYKYMYGADPLSQSCRGSHHPLWLLSPIPTGPAAEKPRLQLCFSALALLAPVVPPQRSLFLPFPQCFCLFIPISKYAYQLSWMKSQSSTCGWLLVLTLTQISGQRKDPAAGRSRCCGTLAATSRDCPADTLHRSLATGFRGAAGNPEQPSGDRDHTWRALARPQARALFSGCKPPCRCVFSYLHLSEPILTSLRDSVLGRTSSHTDVL